MMIMSKLTKIEYGEDAKITLENVTMEQAQDIIANFVEVINPEPEIIYDKFANLYLENTNNLYNGDEMLVDENNRAYIMAQTWVDCPKCGEKYATKERSYNSYTRCQECDRKLFMKYANKGKLNDFGCYFEATTLLEEKGK